MLSVEETPWYADVPVGWSRHHGGRGNHGDDFAAIRCKSRGKATQRGIFFDDDGINHEFLRALWEFQSGNCAISGVELLLRGRKGNYYDRTSTNAIASIDRIDNNGGYTRDNVRFVATPVNLMRNAMDDETLIYWCSAIVKHQSDGTVGDNSLS